MYAYAAHVVNVYACIYVWRSESLAALERFLDSLDESR
jgi:hypothetical protein